LACNNVICSPAIDGKMYNTVLGLGTCDVKHGGPGCIAPTLEDASNIYPTWMEAFIQLFEEGVKPIFKDYPLRQGKHSYEAYFEKLQNYLGKKKEFAASDHAVSEDSKKELASVSNERL
jgi:hypothetical protein